MNLKLYMDVHVPRAVTTGLRIRGVDVLTAQEDGAATLDDGALLLRAKQLDRVLVSQDDDLLREAASLINDSVPFAGVIYGHQLRITIGKMIADLELIAKGTTLGDWQNKVGFLPLD